MNERTPETAAPPAPDPAGGTRIGRYEILDRVGVGGMAEVFRARARGPGRYQRELIIKRILPHLADDPDFVRAFVEEGKILGLLHHPNIVGVYDFGEADGRHYLALEYLDGPSLANLITQAVATERPLPVNVVCYIAREICRGLAAVHALCDRGGRRLNVVHRDVTPTNVMTTRRGQVKLLDFGVAKTVDAARLTQHGTIKGKVGYFAPEQIKGDPIDGRVDLFAVGILMFEALTLEYLFFGEGGPLGAIYRVMEMDIPSLRARRPDVPEALERIVMRALARNRDQRPASADELAAELDGVLAGMLTHPGGGADELAALIHQR